MDFKQALHYYGCLRLLSILHSRAFSSFCLPAILAGSQFLVVSVSAFTILFVDQIGLVILCGVTCLILGVLSLIVTVTKASSMVTEKAGQVLRAFRSETRVERRLKLSTLNHIRELRVYMGTFYYVDPGTLLVTLDIIVGNLINVLLTYR